MTTKRCDKCDRPYEGYGPTCSACRRPKSIPAQRCSVCGSCFLGYRGRCSDCSRLADGSPRTRSRTDMPPAKGSEALGLPQAVAASKSETSLIRRDRLEALGLPPAVAASKSETSAIRTERFNRLGSNGSLGLAVSDELTSTASAFGLYFNTIRIFWEMHCDEVKSLWSQKVVDVDVATAISQQLERRTIELHRKLSPLIEEAFAEHDANEDGYLDRDEAHAFLADYGRSQIPTCEYIVEYGAELSMMRQSPGRDIDQEHLQSVRSTMIAALREQHDSYLERAREHHMKAARSLEKGAECQISQEIVVNALLPGTKQNKKFVQRLPTLLAHGFLPAWSALELRPQGKTLAAIAATVV